MSFQTVNAYIAGFFDGEGSVGCYGPQLTVRFAQKDPIILHWLTAALGYGVVTEHRRTKTHVWRIGSAEHVADFVKRIAPLSVHKAAQLKVTELILAGGDRTSLSRELSQLKRIPPATWEGQMHEEEQRAYVAGLFDGEGCVTAGPMSGVPCVKLNIGQKFRPVLDMVVQMTGEGSIYYAKKVDNHSLSVTGRDSVARFIDFMYPYSLVKRTQLEVARQILDLTMDYGLGRRAIDPEVKRQRIALANELHRLKAVPASPHDFEVPCAS